MKQSPLKYSIINQARFSLITPNLTCAFRKIILQRTITTTTMASSAAKNTPYAIIPDEDRRSFSAHLQKSKRILALLGAGLSASSGLPTFRGVGGMWRKHDAISLATPHAFQENPGLVWQFYGYRRHMALEAEPNKAHYALAELAKKRDFVTLTQNVDGESGRLYQYFYIYSISIASTISRYAA